VGVLQKSLVWCEDIYKRLNFKGSKVQIAKRRLPLTDQGDFEKHTAKKSIIYIVCNA
jgi:hypothetical protein